MEEIWNFIPNTNNDYMVSNLGNIKSKKQILKSNKDEKGYLRIRVRPYGTFKVHREVAKAFITNVENKQQVNHIDGNKENNNINNLEWMTNYENAHHAMDNGLWDNVYAASKRANEKRKIKIKATNIETKEEIIFESINSAERFFNSRHIITVLKGKRTQAKGYSFEYIKGGG